jgi:small subunit ribosomal protein S4
VRHKPVVKLSRSLGLPLTAKAAKIMEVRSYRPGQHGRARHNVSEYGRRLREKQLVRAQYFVSERYLRKAFSDAVRSSGPTGQNLLAGLERRLDSTILRAGFARTIYQARQMVTHGHVLVDGRRVDIPSARVREGEVVSIKPASANLPIALEAKAGAILSTTPRYLEVNREQLSVMHLRPANREEIPVTCDEQLVVEYYAQR